MLLTMRSQCHKCYVIPTKGSKQAKIESKLGKNIFSKRILTKSNEVN